MNDITNINQKKINALIKEVKAKEKRDLAVIERLKSEIEVMESMQDEQPDKAEDIGIVKAEHLETVEHLQKLLTEKAAMNLVRLAFLSEPSIKTGGDAVNWLQKRFNERKTA